MQLFPVVCKYEREHTVACTAPHGVTCAAFIFAARHGAYKELGARAAIRPLFPLWSGLSAHLSAQVVPIHLQKAALMVPSRGLSKWAPLSTEHPGF